MDLHLNFSIEISNKCSYIVITEDEMVKSSTVQVRMPEDLKHEVNEILDTIGMTPSEAVLIYYKQIALNHGLPFEVKIPNAETAEAIREAREGKGITRYSSVDDMFKDLNS